MQKKIKSILLICIIVLALFGLMFLPNLIMETMGIPEIITLIIGMLVVLVLIIILFKTISKKKISQNMHRHQNMQKDNQDKIKGLRKKNSDKNIEQKKIKLVENEQKINSKEHIKELEQKRAQIESEIEIAEKSFLKNKLDQKTFANISKEKNSELIKIEAEIDSFKKVSLSSEEIKQLEEVSEDKKNILEGLLKEKQRKVFELRIAEKNYFKRKIDSDTFNKISIEIKSEMISIESKIKNIQKMSEIEKIKIELKKGAKEITSQQKKSEQRKNENEIFEDDVFDQIDWMVGGLN